MEKQLRIIRRIKNDKLDEIIGIGLIKQSIEDIIKLNIPECKMINSYSFEVDNIVENFVVIEIANDELYEYITQDSLINDTSNNINKLCLYATSTSKIANTCIDMIEKEDSRMCDPILYPNFGYPPNSNLMSYMKYSK